MCAVLAWCVWCVWYIYIVHICMYSTQIHVAMHPAIYPQLCIHSCIRIAHTAQEWTSHTVAEHACSDIEMLCFTKTK